MVLLAACGSSGASTSLRDKADLPAGPAGVGRLPAPASAWPQASHDARHSGTSPDPGPRTAHVRWRRDLGGDVTPGPVVGVDGGIIAATNAGVLHDLDPASGRDRWTFSGGGSYGNDLSTSPAVLGDGTILWPGPGDTLFALSRSGRLLWRERFSGQVLSPAVAGLDRVYVADLAGHLVALEVTPSTHRRVWSVNVGGPDYASPTVGPDGTVYTADDHDLVAVRDLGTRGAVRWRLRTPKLVEVSNGVAPDGTVVLGNNHDHEYGVASDGSVRWRVAMDDNTYSSSVVSPAGIGYYGDNMGRVRVVDTSNGHVRATLVPRRLNSDSVWSSPVVDSAGDYYWVTTAGNLYAYDGHDRPLWHLALDAGSNGYPALAGGTLYVGTRAGVLYAVG